MAMFNLTRSVKNNKSKVSQSGRRTRKFCARNHAMENEGGRWVGLLYTVYCTALYLDFIFDAVTSIQFVSPKRSKREKGLVFPPEHL